VLSMKSDTAVALNIWAQRPRRKMGSRIFGSWAFGGCGGLDTVLRVEMVETMLASFLGFSLSSLRQQARLR
jgi:hypothetical protein